MRKEHKTIYFVHPGERIRSSYQFDGDFSKDMYHNKNFLNYPKEIYKGEIILDIDYAYKVLVKDSVITIDQSICFSTRQKAVAFMKKLQEETLLNYMRTTRELTNKLNEIKEILK